uniref:Uncharacterized protein n=4 Tax=Oryza sativa subsp. japonica TaxID=39947 RepID=Q53LG3_ORYSJ|nr:hypothetical protein LOC_Os11g09070 [Oryza sativa Japonica Group]ABA91879.1 hypothetical protein LOC_Os11g09070 [Oryza sativa Japonica Group]
MLGCLDVRAAREEDQHVARRLRRVDAAHRVDGRAEVVSPAPGGNIGRLDRSSTEPELLDIHAGAGEEAVYNALAEGAVVVQADDDPKVQAARRRGLDAAEHDAGERHPVVRVVHHDGTVAGEDRVGGELAEKRAVRGVLDDRVGVQGAVVEGDGVPHLASETLSSARMSAAARVAASTAARRTVKEKLMAAETEDVSAADEGLPAVTAVKEKLMAAKTEDANAADKGLPAVTAVKEKLMAAETEDANAADEGLSAVTAVKEKLMAAETEDASAAEEGMPAVTTEKGELTTVSEKERLIAGITEEEEGMTYVEGQIKNVKDMLETGYLEGVEIAYKKKRDGPVLLTGQIHKMAYYCSQNCEFYQKVQELLHWKKESEIKMKPPKQKQDGFVAYVIGQLESAFSSGSEQASRPGQESLLHQLEV